MDRTACWIEKTAKKNTRVKSFTRANFEQTLKSVSVTLKSLQKKSSKKIPDRWTRPMIPEKNNRYQGEKSFL
jgi:hypothetical protein